MPVVYYTIMLYILYTIVLWGDTISPHPSISLLHAILSEIAPLQSHITFGLSLIILRSPLKTQLCCFSKVVYQSSGILLSNFEDGRKRAREPDIAME